MEAVLSEQKCQCGLQWAGAIGVGGGAGWRTRRIAESYDKEWYGAGDRDMVIHNGKTQFSVDRAGSFPRLSLIFFHSFLHRSFSILVQFFFTFYITSVFLTRLLSLLRIFPHSPSFTAQRSNSSNSLSPPSLLR
jgi:hypothetical protein